MKGAIRKVKGEWVLIHESGREVARSDSEALLRAYARDAGITVDKATS